MRIVAIILFVLLTWLNGQSQIVINNNNPYNSIVYLIDSLLLGNGVVASNHSFQGDPMQIGFFNATNTTINFDSGLVFGTGDVNLLDPIFSGVVIDPPNTVSDPDLLNVANSVPPLIGQSFTVSSINDVAVIEFDFTPYSDSLFFQYVFGSSEYFEWENTQYNDVFGFFLSGPGITGPYASPSHHPNGSINLAVVPNSNPPLPITISSVNNVTPINAQYFIDNQNNQSIIDYIDGRTTEFDAYYPVNPGQSYHIRLAIADGSDQQLNSYVWLNNFSSTDFSPNVLFSLSDSTCSSKSDLYITVEQDSFEVDIDSSSFFSDRGYIDFSSLSSGDTLGHSSVNNYSSISFSDLIINNIISGSELLLESIDQVTGLSIGTFLVKNITGGGLEIISVNIADTDNFTSAYSNLIVFYNFIVNSNNSIKHNKELIINKIKQYYDK